MVVVDIDFPLEEVCVDGVVNYPEPPPDEGPGDHGVSRRLMRVIVNLHIK